MIILSAILEKNMKKKHVKEFYDVVWTQYIPEYQPSKNHLAMFFKDKEIKDKEILDCGCGTGIFAIIFAALGAKEVTGLDISPGSLATGLKLKKMLGLENIKFVEGDMLQLPYEDETFDIIWAWGSVHHTENPLKAIFEIDRILKKHGKLLLALYKKTKFTWLHEILRKTLIKAPKSWWVTISRIMAFFLYPIVKLKEIHRKKARQGEKLEELILDWYFVPIRYYYKPEEVKKLLEEKGYIIEKFLSASGRFESSSNFIFKAKKT